jgi:peroxiredoxin
VTFVISTVIEQLSALLAAGRAVTVEPVSGQQDVYRLGYQRDPKDDEDRMTHQVVVDAGKGWVITRHEQFFPNGRSARRRTCEYQRTLNQVWMPAKGQIRNLWGGDPSGLDWRFTVRRAAANNPQFDQSIFDVRIPPQFYLTDIRRNVSYWVGERAVSNADLTRLTQQALDAQSARTKGVEIPQDARVDPANKPGTLTQIGRVAPDFSLTTLEQHPFRLADQRGHVVLLNFFATWCGPCQEELPHLQNIWNEFRTNQAFSMLVIGREETTEKVAAFRTKHGFTFPLAADPDRSVYGRFASERIHRTYLISREGAILYQCTGYYETELAKLKALIKAELKKKPRPVGH